MTKTLEEAKTQIAELAQKVQQTEIEYRLAAYASIAQRPRLTSWPQAQASLRRRRSTSRLK